MPIYEYRCESCGAELEKLQKISAPALRECPECGKDTLVKLMSASSFRLKGSGWYETDFKTGKKKNGAAEEAAADSGGSTPAVAADPKVSGADAAGTAAKDNAAKESKAGKDSGAATTGKSGKPAAD
jgi:putative FmdB family regulatory protein